MNNTTPANHEEEIRKTSICDESRLDEETKRKYFGALTQTSSGYDPSVFVEALRDEKGNLHLYVPARKRMAWFKMDFPEGVVVVDPPQCVGRRVTVMARVYKNRGDYQANLPAAINAATRLLADNDEYIVDTCITRAQSRALRDLGYDLPRDAHIIEGWTPIREMPAKVPEEVMEAGSLIQNYMSALAPEVPISTSQPPASAATAESADKETQTVPNQKETPAKTAPQSAPAPVSKGRRGKKAAPAETATKAAEEVASEPKPSQEKKEVKGESQPEISQEVAAGDESSSGEKSKTQKPAEVAAEAVEATEEAASEPKSSQEEKAVTGESQPESSQKAAVSSESPSNEKPKTLKLETGLSGQGLMERAKAMFINYENAEAYRSRWLGQKTVGEQSDLRLKYYVQKLLDGECRDIALGLAAYMVAVERGYVTTDIGVKMGMQ